MIARSVHHVSFPIRDLARSRQFYGEVLGLEEIERPDFPFPGAWYRAGNAEVHLIVPSEGVDTGRRPERIHPFAGHAAFAIDDYEQVRDYLKSQSIEVLETNARMGQLWVQDPDGNVLEFTTSKFRS